MRNILWITWDKHIKITHYIKDRWQAKCGYKEVLIIALPLIISTGSWSLQHFIDRMFLTWYSPEAIAASVPSGILNYTIMSIFIGTAGYVGTFVAQYYGAGQSAKIVKIVWQGIYIALFAAIIHLALVPFAEHIFHIIGHNPIVQKEEVIYFQFLNLGAFFIVGSAAISGFFSGRGKTMVIMWLNIVATIVNICFNYGLIFGKWGFPELGIKGAAISSVMSQVVLFGAYCFILFKSPNKSKYNFLKGYKLDKALLLRLLKFGLPNGIQIFIEIFGIAFFILLIGRLGTDSLAASNIALNVNLLAFMPMIGFGMTVSILVGQYIGKKNIPLAEYSVYSCMHLTFLYMLIIATLYVIIPDLLLAPFTMNSHSANMTEIMSKAKTLLLFIAFYSLFDTFNIIFANAIKGAGDTKFVMYMITLLTIVVLAVPCFIFIEILQFNVYFGWALFTVYVCALAMAFYWRYKTGKWKGMKVIEEVI